MVVTSDKATHNEKWIKTDYPFEEGLELGTTKLKDDSFLVPDEKSVVREIDRVGIY